MAKQKKRCAHQLANERIKREYPIQDVFWPSRRWNKEQTQYEDLTGCNCHNK